MMLNIKSHLQIIGKVLYTYFLVVAISWAAFPILVVLSQQFGQIYVIQSIYTFVITVVMVMMMYITMHGVGEKERKPYEWVRYNCKGFVCGAIAFAGIIILELCVIFLANEYIDVHHPYFSIETLNRYAKLIIYMPFFWIYRIISPATTVSIVPEVTYLTSILPIVIVTLSSGIGYIMGFNGIRIIKKGPKSAFLRKFFYGGPRKAKKQKNVPKEDAK